MRETRESNESESLIKKRAASDAIPYLKEAPDTKMLYTEILDSIAAKTYEELGIKISSGERELYLSTLVDAAGIKTDQ